jgi:hypothetical protein
VQWELHSIVWICKWTERTADMFPWEYSHVNTICKTVGYSMWLNSWNRLLHTVCRSDRPIKYSFTLVILHNFSFSHMAHEVEFRNSTAIKSESSPVTGLNMSRGWIEIQLYTFVTSALEGGVWSALRPGCFTPGKDPLPIVQKTGWAPGPVWTCVKISPPQADLRTVQPLYRLSYSGNYVS